MFEILFEVCKGIMLGSCVFSTLAGNCIATSLVPGKFLKIPAVCIDTYLYIGESLHPYYGEVKDTPIKVTISFVIIMILKNFFVNEVLQFLSVYTYFQSIHQYRQ